VARTCAEKPEPNDMQGKSSMGKNNGAKAGISGPKERWKKKNDKRKAIQLNERFVLNMKALTNIFGRRTESRSAHMWEEKHEKKE